MVFIIEDSGFESNNVGAALMKTRSPVEKHSEEKLSAPPGFESLTTFTLRRAETVEEPSSFMVTESPHDMEISSMPTSSGLDGSAIIKKSLKLKHRPWIVYDQFQCEEEADSKQHYMGVICGCPDCSDCQKVSARWDPEDACTYMLQEAPVFHPNEEEFKDTSKYIDSIRQHVEPYGFCRIVPPPSWQLPCFLEESDVWQRYKFSTRVERVNELQNNWSSGKASEDEDTRETKRRRLAYGYGDGCDANFVSTEYHGAQSCQSESGPQFTLIAFKRYADYFQQHYFSRVAEGSDAKVNPNMRPKEWKPSEQNIEGEYWRIVEKPTEEIEVLHGVDLDFKSFGCEFPESSNPKQASAFEEKFTSGWNMKNISSLPGSLLSFEKSDSVILTPRLQVGMCFSSLPWTVEEHQLYKLCYLHLGAPRIWYGTSRCDPYKVEVVINMPLRDSSEENPELHRKLGRQVSPATLKAEDIPVYRCIQRPREFVLFLPGAYHSGFDCGFNCSVSAAFAPLDWLPHGLNSVELYRERRWKTSISYDKLLLRAANEAIKTQWQCLVMGKKIPMVMAWKGASGKGRILAKTLKTRIKLETNCREYLSSASQSRKMDKAFDIGDRKRECITCFYDLYLSAVSCPCTPGKFSCLKHAKYLCSCPWRERNFHFRYLISELNTLLEAVEGKLSAIRSWVKEDLGSILYWDSPDENQHGSAVDPHCIPEASNGKGTTFENDEPSTSNSLLKAKSPIDEISSGNPKGKESAAAMDSNPIGEISSRNLKGKEIAVAMVSDHSDDSSDDTSSVSSLESDIEAYIAELRSCTMRNKTRENGITKQNVGVSNEAVPEKEVEASSLKLLSGAKTQSLGAGNPKGPELKTAAGTDLNDLSEDTEPSLSSSSESDVEAYIEHLKSRIKRCSSPVCDNVKESRRNSTKGNLGH